MPDVMYARYPHLARLLEDMIDQDPTRRMVVSGRDDYRNYENLSKLFLGDVRSMSAFKRTSDEPIEGLAWSRISPFSGEPLFQLLMWMRSVTNHGTSRGSSQTGRLFRWIKSLWARVTFESPPPPWRRRDVSWLFLGSWVAGLVSAIAATFVLWWTARDLGWQWGGFLIDALQHAYSVSADEFPLVMSLGQMDIQFRIGKQTGRHGL